MRELYQIKVEHRKNQDKCRTCLATLNIWVFIKVLYGRCDFIRFLFGKKNNSDYRVKTGRELTGEDLLGNYSNNLGER